jgi:cell division septal protein FtsQ
MRLVADVDAALLQRTQGRRRLAVVAGVLTLLALAGGYAALRASSVFAVKGVSVDGADGLVAREVRSAIWQHAGGASLLAADTAKLETLVEGIPEVRTAHVDRAFPNRIAVTVERYRPAALVRAGTGDEASRYLVSRDGQVMRAPVKVPSALPRIMLPAGSTLIVGEATGDANLQAALRVLKTTPAAFRRRIGRITKVVPQSGTVVAYMKPGMAVRFGAPDQLDVKLRVVDQLVHEFPIEQLRATAYVDVSAPARPALGMK